MKQIWTVEIGEYSEFQILAIFELEEDAKRFAEKYNNDPNISEFSLRASVGKIEYWPAGTVR